MKGSYGATIEKHFSSLNDPRMIGKVKHKLIYIITITLCAVIIGADAWTEVEEHGKAEYEGTHKKIKYHYPAPVQNICFQLLNF